MRHGKLFTLLVAGALLAGCVEEPQKRGSGQFLVDVSASAELNVVATRATENLPAAVTLPTADQFGLKITQDENPVRTFTAIPSEPVTLEEGNYTAAASYGNPEEEGFGKPCFGATEDFTIMWDGAPGYAIAEVEMTATLTNMAVSVEYTDTFKDYFADYDVEILRGSATEPIVEFAKDETRLAFIKPQAFKVKVNYKRYDDSTGKSATHDITADVAACTWQRITLGVDDVNGANITITWNDEMEPIDLGEINVGDPE
jgi:hypothetical protein